ncbi:Cell morphogenesis protein PAG1, partial [Quaeritorhiza haematococci]
MMISLAHEGVEGSAGAVLTTYGELLEIWLRQVEEEGKVWAEPEADWVVEEIESRGLIHLCSQVPAIRRQAIRILRLAHEFELKLKKKTVDELDGFVGGKMTPEAERAERRRTLQKGAAADVAAALKYQYTLPRNLSNPRLRVRRTRIIRIMEEMGVDLVRRHYHDPVLATSTRTEHNKVQLEQRQKEHLNLLSNETLLHIASSESSQDAMIWNRCFPDLIKWCFDYASPRTIQLCLRDVLSRIDGLQPSIMSAADQTQQQSQSKPLPGPIKVTIPVQTSFGGDRDKKG